MGVGLSALCLLPECGVLWEHEMGILVNLYMGASRMWCSLGAEQSLNVHPRTRCSQNVVFFGSSRGAPRMWCSLGAEQSLNVHPRTRVEV